MIKHVIPKQLDSYLSEEQYEALIENDVQRLFKTSDIDSSGYIEFSEFAKLVSEMELLVVGFFVFYRFLYVGRERACVCVCVCVCVSVSFS
jgi:hypothetical protein